MPPRKVPVLTAAEKLKIVERFKAGESSSRLAREVGVASSTIRGWKACEHGLDRIANRAIVDGLDYSKFDNDPGDERRIPVHEKYELSLALGHLPDEYSDAKYSAKYGKWLSRLSRKRFEDIVKPEDRTGHGEKLSAWLRSMKSKEK